MTTPDPDLLPGADPQRFSAWLCAHRDGQLDDDLTAHLIALAEAVVLQDKPAKLAVTFTIRPESEGVVIATAVKVNEPQVSSSAFYYVDSRSQELTTRDPRQPELPYTTTTD